MIQIEPLVTEIDGKHDFRDVIDKPSPTALTVPSVANSDTIQRAKSQKSMYLRDQWSDSVHTLRFDSTDEYFKTVEYEEQRSTELRDSERKPCGSAAIFCLQTSPQTLFFQILSFV